MRLDIKERIEQVRRGEAPEGYIYRSALVFPELWSYQPLSTALCENRKLNKEGKFSKKQVLSVSGEMGVVNQIDLLGRSYAGKSVLDYHVVYHENIVYTKSPLKNNPYGIIKLNKGQAGIVSTLYAVYNCTSPVTGRYLDYFFSIDRHTNNYLKPLVKRGAKNDMKVNNGDVISGRIPFPPFLEQKKIVEILSRCDKVISLKKQLIDEKRRQKKWLMRNLLDPDSGVRLPGFEGEWDRTALEQFGVFQKGIGISNDNCANGTSPCVKYGDIYKAYGVWFDKPVSYTTPKIAVKAPNVTNGTLLFTGSGEDHMEIGKCTVYLGESQVAVGGDIIIMHPNKTKAYPLFLAYQQGTTKLTIQKAKKSQGHSIVHLYAEQIKKLQIDVPPSLCEQTAIANVLSTADREIDLLEQELAEWKSKKKALMQLLLTGIVRV